MKELFNLVAEEEQNELRINGKLKKNKTTCIREKDQEVNSILEQHDSFDSHSISSEYILISDRSLHRD